MVWSRKTQGTGETEQLHAPLENQQRRSSPHRPEFSNVKSLREIASEYGTGIAERRNIVKLDWKKRFGVYSALAMFGVAAATVAGPGVAHAAAVSETAQCFENGSAIFSKDFTFNLQAPASTPAATPFTVTINPVTIDLPSTASDGTTAVTSWQDLVLQFQVQGGAFVDGSVQQGAGATANGSPVTETGSASGDVASFAIGGPVDPGTLVTSHWTVRVLPADGSTSVTLTAVGWNATANTAGGALADVCSLPSDTLVTVSVGAATATTAPPTTLGTTVPGPSTTVAVAQTKIHGSSTDVNNCNSTLNPPLQPPSTTKIGVTLSSDAFPQPHEGDPITLSNTKVAVNIPASLLQLGVDANLIKNGDKVPSKLNLVVNGSSTTQGTHVYKVSATATISVIGGKAQPLMATLPLPNTTWTPVNSTTPVFFSEKSMTIVSSLNLPGIGAVTVNFTCDPSTASSFIALAAQGSGIPVSQGGSDPGSGTAGGSGVSATASGSGELPRTGGSTLILVVLALATIDAGLLALRASQRVHVGRR